MAFVNSVPIGASFQPAVLSHSSFCKPTLTNPTRRTGDIKRTKLRMGYGDYSYLTDKTKGHVQQYYVDKFRVVADFAKGAPKSIDDAVIGRDIKNAKRVPTQGIPQEIDPILIPGPPPEDPRTAEAAGAVYPWDVAYKNPKFAPESYANVNDESVAETAFMEFRASVSESRGASLTAMDFGAQARLDRLSKGIDESYLLCLDGALDAEYLRLQRLANPPGLNPTGIPQTEIPGIPYLSSVGAIDMLKKKRDEFVFWKDTAAAETSSLPYKKPSGKDTPELPYNTSSTVEELNKGQSARGLLPEN